MPDKTAVTRTRAEAFNEWMRLFIEEPNRFEHQWKTVTKFLTEAGVGKEPSYGESCDVWLAKLEAGD